MDIAYTIITITILFYYKYAMSVLCCDDVSYDITNFKKKHYFISNFTNNFYLCNNHTKINCDMEIAYIIAIMILLYELYNIVVDRCDNYVSYNITFF